MFDRITNKINNLKKDKTSFKKYAKCFCDIQSVKDFFKKDKDFVKLKNSVTVESKPKEEFYD